MKKAEYLAHIDVENFTAWLSERVNGKQPIDFNNQRGINYKYIHDALHLYAWPDKTKYKIPLVHIGYLPLRKDAGLYQNKLILDEIQNGLKNAKCDTELAEWASSTMHWGGVTAGNNNWLEENKTGLLNRTREIVNFVSNNDDNVDAWLATANHQIKFKKQNKSLRFNAGWTKVISLLCDGFIIYDSRVAGALAWLVKEWSSSTMRHW